MVFVFFVPFPANLVSNEIHESMRTIQAKVLRVRRDGLNAGGGGLRNSSARPGQSHDDMNMENRRPHRRKGNEEGPIG